MPSHYFIRPADFAQERADKPFKHTFLQSGNMLVGLNTLRPGQGQPLHDHPDQDKFYFVLEGNGRFTVDGSSQVCGAGELILAPAGVPHGVSNEADAPLTFITVIAPFPTA